MIHMYYLSIWYYKIIQRLTQANWKINKIRFSTSLNSYLNLQPIESDFVLWVRQSYNWWSCNSYSAKEYNSIQKTLWLKFRFCIINELMVLIFQLDCVSLSPVILKHRFYFFRYTWYYLTLIRKYILRYILFGWLSESNARYEIKKITEFCNWAYNSLKLSE